VASSNILGFIPSDVAQWTTLFVGEIEEPHVVPKFGPKHSPTLECWCHPVWNIERYDEDVVMHNVAQ
jgi:hypothetical protein